jgi:threonine efflux protein
MSNLQPILTVAALNVAAAISPGPAFLIVSKTAAASTRRAALLVVAGIVTGSVIWAVAALLGVQLILAKAASIYRFLQLFGGVYLAYIGWSVWRGAAQPLAETSAPARGGGFRKALLINLSNPKVIIFFGSVFGTVFKPSTPLAVRWAAVPTVFLIDGTWYCCVALLFGILPVQRIYRRIKTGFERTCGGFLVLFGAKLVWTGARGDN